MYQLKCAGCGGQVEVPSLLAAANAKCPGCGRYVIEGAQEPTKDLLREGPSQAPLPSLVDNKHKALILSVAVGGLAGAVLVPLVGYSGGKFGPPFVGAIGCATSLTFIICLRAGAVAGVIRGLITGDHSWFDLWMCVLMVLGVSLGSGLGLLVDRMSTGLAVWGGIGGFVLGAVLGGVFGPSLFEKQPEQAPQEAQEPVGTGAGS